MEARRLQTVDDVHAEVRAIAAAVSPAKATAGAWPAADLLEQEAHTLRAAYPRIADNLTSRRAADVLDQQAEATRTIAATSRADARVAAQVDDIEGGCDRAPRQGRGSRSRSQRPRRAGVIASASRRHAEEPLCKGRGRCSGERVG